MNTFEITIQRKSGDNWPVVVEHSQSGVFLPTRSEGLLHLDLGELKKQTTPLTYGTVLGKALFRDEVRDAFVRARATGEDTLRVLLVVEDPKLKLLRWERLCASIRLGGKWAFLARDQRTFFSLYLPSRTDRLFRPIGSRDLRALVLVGTPENLEEYSLSHFNADQTVSSVCTALGEIPSEVLATVAGAVGPPTLDELCKRITAEQYTLLHIVAHGWFRRDDGETILYLADADNQVTPVTATRLLERLDQLEGARGLPHFVFLATCESASAEAEGALGGLAQRLVRELGIPAVLAMTEKVSIITADALTKEFYLRLREHGEPDRALVEACAGLADRYDITVPALYSRLGGRPMFSDTAERPLTNKEIEFGLSKLEELLPKRAPVLEKTFNDQAAILRKSLDTDPEALSEAARQERRDALVQINTICDEALDLSFNALALGQEPPKYDERCPFQGLYPFHEDDQEFFFGREALVQKLVRRLKQDPFLAVLGPSGSGKSSVVLAGLIPTLQEENSALRMAYLTPGNDPLSQLETSVAELGEGPVALMVDQFEELFTLCSEKAKRQAFLDRLLTFPERLPVVITMRADFWGECAPYSELREQMQARQELIAPMDTAELRRAMEQQVRKVGLRFEADLSHTILEDVQDEPGAMPLLQHALQELWKRRHGQWLRTEEYRAIGGVRKAIAETADVFYKRVSPEEQARVRDIFVRLTRLDEETVKREERRDTRRRVWLKELVPAESDQAATKDLVRRLADTRLVVTSVNPATKREEVEVAHEALIRYWPRLRDWLDEDRANLQLRERISEAAREWEDGKREESLLIHRGSRLEEAEVLARTPKFLSELEQAYVDACVALRERERAEKEEQQRRELEAARKLAEEAQARQAAEEEARQEAEQRAEEQARAARQELEASQKLAKEAEARQKAEEQTRREAERRAEEQTKSANRLRRRALALAIVVVLAIGAAVFGWVQQRKAQKNAILADKRAEETEIERGKAETRRIEAEKAQEEAEYQARASRIALSKQLAAQAQEAFKESHPRGLLLALEALNVTSDANDPPVQLAKNVLRQFVVKTGGWGLKVSLEFGEISSWAISPNSRWFVIGHVDGSIQLWDLKAEVPVASPVILHGGEDEIEELIFSPNDHWLVAISWGDAQLWDLTITDLTSSIPVSLGILQDLQDKVLFSPDNRWLVTTNDDDTIGLWDLTAFDVGVQPAILGKGIEGWAETISSNSRWLVTVHDYTSTLLWDLTRDDPANHPLVFGREVEWNDSVEQLVEGASAGPEIAERVENIKTHIKAGVRNEEVIRIFETMHGSLLEKAEQYLATTVPEGLEAFTYVVVSNFIAKLFGNTREYVERAISQPVRVPDSVDVEPLNKELEEFFEDVRFFSLRAEFPEKYEDFTPDDWVKMRRYYTPLYSALDLQDPFMTKMFFYEIQSQNYTRIIEDSQLWPLYKKMLDSIPSVARQNALWSAVNSILEDTVEELWSKDYAKQLFEEASPIHETAELIENIKVRIQEKTEDFAPNGILEDTVEELWSKDYAKQLFEEASPIHETAELIENIKVRIQEKTEDFASDIRTSQNTTEFSATYETLSPDSRWLVTRSDDGSTWVWDLMEDDPTANPVVFGKPKESTSQPQIIDKQIKESTPQPQITDKQLEENTSPQSMQRDEQVIERFEAKTDELLSKAQKYLQSSFSSNIIHEEIGIPLISPDSRWLVSENTDGTVHLWDLTELDASSSPIILHEQQEGIEHTAGAISPDSRWLITFSSDVPSRTINAWDLKASHPGSTRRVLFKFEEEEIWQPKFSPDSRWFVVTGYSGPARLWNLTAAVDSAIMPLIVSNENLMLNYERNTNIMFSPDSRWLINGSSNGTARLWDLHNFTGSALVLREHGEDYAIILAISPDSRWFITAGISVDEESLSSMRLWSLSVEGYTTHQRDNYTFPHTLDLNELRQIACGKAGRNLTEAEWEQYFPDLPYGDPTCTTFSISPSYHAGLLSEEAKRRYTRALQFGRPLSSYTSVLDLLEGATVQGDVPSEVHALKSLLYEILEDFDGAAENLEYAKQGGIGKHQQWQPLVSIIEGNIFHERAKKAIQEADWKQARIDQETVNEFFHSVITNLSDKSGEAAYYQLPIRDLYLKVQGRWAAGNLQMAEIIAKVEGTKYQHELLVEVSDSLHALVETHLDAALLRYYLANAYYQQALIVKSANPEETIRLQQQALAELHVCSVLGLPPDLRSSTAQLANMLAQGVESQLEQTLVRDVSLSPSIALPVPWRVGERRTVITATSNLSFDEATRQYEMALRSANPLPYYKAALEELDAALEHDPNLWQAYAIKGLIYRNLEDFDRALENFKIAEWGDSEEQLQWIPLVKYSTYGDILHRFAGDAFRAGDWEEARIYQEAAMQFTHTIISRSLSRLEEQSQDHEELQSMRKALHIETQSRWVEGKFQMAAIAGELEGKAQQQALLEEVLTRLQPLIEMYPDIATLRYYLAQAYYKQSLMVEKTEPGESLRMKEQALTQLRMCAEHGLPSNLRNPAVQLLNTVSEGGEPETEQKLLAVSQRSNSFVLLLLDDKGETVSTVPNNVNLDKAEKQYIEGLQADNPLPYYKAALNALDAAIARDPNVLQAYAIKGLIYRDLEDFELATKNFEIAKQGSSIGRLQWVPAMMNLIYGNNFHAYASAAIRSGDWERAKGYQETAFEFFNNVIDTPFNSLKSYQDKEQLAIRIYDIYLKAQERWAASTFQMAAIARQLEGRERPEELLQDVVTRLTSQVKTYPDAAGLRYYLAEGYYKQSLLVEETEPEKHQRLQQHAMAQLRACAELGLPADLRNSAARLFNMLSKGTEPEIEQKILGTIPVR
ncbi:MAG: CHAT domain-containing protein [Gammaproteobacteria bacterium]|nr:CHAT domain-containing protein [Gammaproteobacteria bacterium]